MSRNTSVMKHQFSEVPAANIPRSTFDRSHGYKTTFDAGLLVPVFVDEALPGDTFNLRMTGFGRMATPIHPIMDNLFLESFFFAVPNRLVWDNWERFNGEQDNPDDSTDYIIPQQGTPQDGLGWKEKTVYDHMGLPLGVDGLSCSALFIRAYNLIWNDWFRDQNLQESESVPTDDSTRYGEGPVLRRGKRHDYFTSALPFPQKGDPVTIPIQAAAPVVPVSGKQPTFDVTEGSGDNYGLIPDVSNDWQFVGSNFGAGSAYWSETALEADLTQATAITINELRQAFQIQRLLERDARGGTRYIEIIKSHFGVTSPDARLQRPEYLGGGHQMVNINPVQQTSFTDETSPQGNLAGYGTVSFTGHGFTKSFTEHCIIFGMVSVRADLTYQQGINRMFSRLTRYDFYWPALSHLGEQVVENREIFADGSANDLLAFGYQERYAEYRYKPSVITGKFRSSDPETLDSWHLSQQFATLPQLGGPFIEDRPPIDRVIAVPTEPHFIFDAYFNFKCARPMPIYSVPGMVDHF